MPSSKHCSNRSKTQHKDRNLTYFCNVLKIALENDAFTRYQTGFHLFDGEENPLLITAYATFQSVNLVSMEQILNYILEFLKIALLFIAVIVFIWGINVG